MLTVRRLLLWLLVAVLPIQGSAAMAAACGMHRSVPAVQQHHAAPEAHCGMADAADAKAPDHQGKCGGSSSCCLAACAPMSAAPALAAPHQPFVTPISREPAMTGHIPATPERPPRLAA
ncbi:hypothetical protein [Massilia endophytica]|uniref:hypothetical protein n=1 Tax=Massilia endophytica TaxID=2899220 RepID=UPI001E3544F8|nr:hypothetical protein [Massilia endophytica]UGQ49105.1 hypothetical protein LSQ66_11765 [Massilia endophytica]